MPTIERLISQLPIETQELFRFVWDSLPESEKSSFRLLAGSMPSNSTLMKLLVKISTIQLKMAFGKKKQVAIVGPANVGKSTLYNQFIQATENLAVVSPTPGTTRFNQSADAGLFSIVDTPGADAVGQVGEQEKELALDAAVKADFLIIMFDAIQGIKQTELDLYQQLKGLGKPHLIVLNKIDLVKKESKSVIEATARNLKIETDQVIPIVAKDGSNLDKVLLGIAMLEPEIVSALGRGMPQFRRRLAWRNIVSAASASAVVALTPLPVIDFIPLVTIQTIMVLGIARIFAYEITPARAREIIATFGLGFLGRTLFYELSKLGGVPGWIIGSAIATSMTVAMGYAAIIWFESGERISNERLSKLTKDLSGKFIASIRGIGSKKPKKASLSAQITSILENTSVEELELPPDVEPADETGQGKP